jgi:hypothetical protein
MTREFEYRTKPIDSKEAEEQVIGAIRSTLGCNSCKFVDFCPVVKDNVGLVNIMYGTIVGYNPKEIKKSCFSLKDPYQQNEQ